MMNFKGIIIGSRFRSFMDVVDSYLSLCQEDMISPEDAHKALMAVWENRMKEWGWNIQELLTLITEFNESSNRT